MSLFDEQPFAPVPESQLAAEAIQMACGGNAHRCGAGRRGARLLLVGEQPGDREDIEGLPFVGPAGRTLNEGLERAASTAGTPMSPTSSSTSASRPGASDASTRHRSASTSPPADRGQPQDSDLADLVTLTAHPSSILRARDDDERAAAMEQFVSDLSSVGRWMAAHRE